MSLLSLDRVSKHYGGHRRHLLPVLRSVSLTIAPGELVAVLGRRRSGRTTLLSVAAGVEPPTEGVVRFDGVDMAKRSTLGVEHGVGFCASAFPPAMGGTVAEQVMTPLLAGNVGLVAAHRAAEAALRRVGAEENANRSAAELSHSEATRVVLARALVMTPRLLVIDEPLAGVPLARERDELLDLLRDIAHRDRVSVFMTVDDSAELAGADRALTIDAGELRGDTSERPPADVVPLRRGIGS
jgi:putative ABC transport system ATP-binding protein